MLPMCSAPLKHFINMSGPSKKRGHWRSDSDAPYSKKHGSWRDEDSLPREPDVGDDAPASASSNAEASPAHVPYEFWRDPANDDVDEEALEKEQAAVDFVDRLVYMNAVKQLTATDLCILCYLVMRMGHGKPMSDFALGPGAHTSHYQRKLDVALGTGEKTHGTTM